MESVADVAPLTVPPLDIFTLFFLHWYVGDVPAAVTLKVTDCPTHLTCETGCPEIDGGEFIVIVALPSVKPLVRGVQPEASATLIKL